MILLTAILRVALICLEVVVLFNFIILIHELGHFLAARWRGLVVDRFSIWFGKPIWQKKVGNVVWSLGSIPFGGFVSLPQMAPMEWLEGRVLDNGELLRPAKPLDKIIVAVAGPLFSLSLAFVFATAVWLIGRPISQSEATNVIGYVAKDSPAEAAGLRPGDKILTVDGHPVSRFNGLGDSISWRVVASEGRTVRIEYERDGKVLVAEPEPTKDPVKGWQRENLRQIKIAPAETPMIAEVAKGSPAERAGLRPSDLITAVNHQRIYHPSSVADILRAGGTNAVAVSVTRSGQTFEVSIRPEFAVSGDLDKVPRLGLVWDQTGLLTMSYPTPWEQVSGVLNNMFNTFQALFSSKSDIKPQHLSGPVGIMRIYYLVFENEHAWRMALWFSVLLNVNLALLNLLPMPMLDGGHITLSVIESIRRRPLSEPFVRWTQTAGAVLVIGFILYVTSYDLIDLRGPRATEAKSAKEPLRFAPAPGSTPVPAK
jgi:regulator of sigma E protease